MDEIRTYPAEGLITDASTLSEGLAAGNVGVWRWKVDTDQLEWSANLESVHALPPGSFDGSLRSFQNDVHPSDSKAVWNAIQRTVETGQPYRVVYRSRAAGDDEPRWIEASGRLITGKDGARYLTGVCMDVTMRRAAERELARRLKQQKAIEEFGTFAFGESETASVLDRAVKVAAEQLSVPLTKILMFAGTADHLQLMAGIGWQEGLVGKASVGIERASQAGFTLLDGGPVIVKDLRTETRFSGPPLLHDHGVRSGLSVVIPGSSARPYGVFGVHDTRLRKFTAKDAEFLLSLATIVANAVRHREAADHHQLLVREMAHRAGNMLQLVSTIANQTFSTGRNMESARRAFNERLGSLSRANYLVAHGGWTSTRIRPLFEEALGPFAGMIVLDGRDVLLPPDLCFDLALVLHELATNAAKYGSLAGENGQVELSWSAERENTDTALFTMIWRDPRNTEDPSQVHEAGFGSRLLTALVEKKWEGRIDIDRTSGYRFQATIPFTPV